jgi:hypothetical protein
MKLRISGNSLRIRVTRSELEALRGAGSVEEQLTLSPEVALRYRLELTDSGPLRAELTDNCLTLDLPAASADSWFAETSVSVEGSQPVGSANVQLLVEKDFQCLVPREGEDQTDYFANPANIRE